MSKRNKHRANTRLLSKQTNRNNEWIQLKTIENLKNKTNKVVIIPNKITLKETDHTIPVILENKKGNSNDNKYISPLPASADFMNVLYQVEETFKIVIGEILLSRDFNAHSQVKGCGDIDPRGEQLTDFSLANDLYLQNPPNAPASFSIMRSEIKPRIARLNNSDDEPL